MGRCLILLLWTALAAGQELRFAELGECKLESGERIQDCRIGYRTFGKLDAGRSNALLVLTWFGGTSESASTRLAKIPEHGRYFVVVVDALGDGVSSSPSNSLQQPRMRFPRFSIRDMVETQHRLLVEKLGITRLLAVMGFSMGGMQALEWAIAYPEFMRKAISIAGSPRLAPYDLMLWQLDTHLIMGDPEWRSGEYTQNPARVHLSELGVLTQSTPEAYNAHTTRAEVLAAPARFAQEPGFDANNRIRQAQAMTALDISAGFGGEMEKAAAAVKAQVLMIISKRDHVVTPGPARDLARLLGGRATLLEYDVECGHGVLACKGDEIAAAIREFLARD